MSTNNKADIEIVIGANKIKTKSQVEKDLRKILDEINKERYFSNGTRGVKVGVKASAKTQITTDLKTIFKRINDSNNFLIKNIELSKTATNKLQKQLQEALGQLKIKDIKVENVIKTSNTTSNNTNSNNSSLTTTKNTNQNANVSVDKINSVYSRALKLQKQIESSKYTTDKLKTSIKGVITTLNKGITLDKSNMINSVQMKTEELQQTVSEINNIRRQFDEANVTSAIDKKNTVTYADDNKIETLKNKIKNVSDALSTASYDTTNFENRLNELLKKFNTPMSVNAFKSLKEEFNVINSEISAVEHKFSALSIKSINFDKLQTDSDELKTKLSNTYTTIMSNVKKLNKEQQDLIQSSNFSFGNTGVKGIENTFDNVNDDIRIYTEKLEGYKTQYVNYINTIKNEEIGSYLFDDAIKGLKELQNEVDLSTQEINKKVNNAFSSYGNLSKNIGKTQNNIKSVQNLLSSINIWGKQNDRIFGNTKMSFAFKSLRSAVENATQSMHTLTKEEQELLSKDLASQFKELKESASEAGVTGQTALTKLTSQADKLGVYLSASTLLYSGINQVKQMYQNVLSLDTAMTELKKVTDETGSKYDSFLTSSISKSKELGASITDYVNATADFARLGYDTDSSAELAESSILYKQVADDINNVEDASSSLISTMKAFNISASQSQTIVDKFNEVSNKFSISSGGIGTALQKSASSLSSANNTLSESLGLIVAGNDVVQDPDIVGNGIKTIALRLRAASTELEEAGLDTDGVAKSVSDLRQELKALSGVDIMIDDNTFKSTYQIFQEMSKVWSGLSDISKASITDLAAGKHQANLFDSIMNNFADAEKTVETANNSAGSASKEHAKVLESLAGKVEILKSSYEALSKSIINDDSVKSLIEGATQLLDLLTELNNGLGTFGTILTGVTGVTVFRLTKQFSSLNEFIQHIKNGINSIGSSKNSIIQELSTQKDSLISSFIKTDNNGNSSWKLDDWLPQIAENKEYQERATAIKNEGLAVEKYQKEIKNLQTEYFQKEFNNQLKETNATLTTNIKATDEAGEVVSKLGDNYKKSVKGISTFGSTLKSIGISALVSLGVGLASFGVESGIKALNEQLSQSQKAIDTANEKQKELSDEFSKVQENKSSLSSIQDEFLKLNKGVSSTGENLTLTNSEFERYNTLANQIGDIFPSLVKGWTEQGNAIISNKTNVEDLTNALKEQEEQYQRNLALNANDVFSGFKAKVNNDYATYFDIAGTHIKEDSDVGYGKQEEILNSILTKVKNKKKMYLVNDNFLENFTFRQEEYLPEEYQTLDNNEGVLEKVLKDIGIDLNNFLKQYNNYIDNPNDTQNKAQVETWLKQIEIQIKSFSGLKEAEFDNTKSNIIASLEQTNSNLNDKQKSLLEKIVNAIDYKYAEKFTDENGNVDINTLVANLQTKLIDALNNGSDEVKQAYSNMLNLSDKYSNGKVTASNYVKSIKDDVKNSGLDKDLQEYLLKALNVEDIENMISNIKGRFKDNENKNNIEKYIDSLNNTEIELLYNIDNVGDLSLDELKSKIEASSKEAQKFSSIINTASESFKALNDEIDNVQSAYDTMKNVIIDYNKNGNLTVDNVQAIMALGDDYIKLLDTQSGKIRLNTAEYQKLITVKKEELKLEAIRNSLSLIKSLNSEAKALEYLTKTKVDYASITQKEYNSLYTYIETQKNSGKYSKKAQSAFNEVLNTLNKTLALYDEMDTSYTSQFDGLTKLEREYNENKEALENQQTALNNQKEALEDVKTGYEKQKEALEDVVDGYEKQKDVINNNINALEKNKSALEDLLSTYNEDKDSINELIDLTTEYVKQTYDDKITAIEKEKDAYEDKIEKLKENLDAEKDLYEYQKSISSKKNDISTTKKQIAALKNSNSTSDKKRLQELQNQLSEQQQDLTDTQYNNSIDVRKEALDNEYALKEALWNKETEKLHEVVNNERRMRTEAMNLIDSRSNVFYNNLWNYTYQYTTKSKFEFETLWTTAYTVLDKYNLGQYNTMSIMDMLNHNIYNTQLMINNVDGQIQLLENQIEVLQGYIDGTTLKINDVEAAIDGTTGSINNVEAALDGVKNKINDIETAYQQATKEAESFNNVSNGSGVGTNVSKTKTKTPSKNKDSNKNKSNKNKSNKNNRNAVKPYRIIYNGKVYASSSKSKSVAAKDIFNSMKINNPLLLTSPIYGIPNTQFSFGNKLIEQGNEMAIRVWILRNMKNKYAKGTSYSKQGVAIVDEEGIGSEYILKSNKGRTTYLPEGSVVFNKSETQLLKSLVDDKDKVKKILNNADYLDYIGSKLTNGSLGIKNNSILTDSLKNTMNNINSINNKTNTSMTSNVNMTVNNNGERINEQSLVDKIEKQIIKDFNRIGRHWG